MRYLILSLCCAGVLAGCQSHKTVEEKPTALTATLPAINTEKEPGLFDQYHVGGFSVGGWVNQKLGQYYAPIKPQNEQAAVVYLYRPDTRWNRQEIAAANLFINGHRIPSLLHNHYYWVELPAGTYRLSVSRPLAGLHFQKPKYLDFTVDAAQTYFIKYDEENKISRSEHTGPFMITPDKVAHQEIAFTRLKSSSYNFVAQDESGKVRSKPQELKPAKYDEKSEVHLVKPFKLWNPLTW
ncbi:DUF2846 domain-containing protein [Acinetobacter dispersus]|uniref:DUF2846 domain-containing protein n=1 Tax=Acinetobacter dispersus TaxID=70348 RepID=UPI0002D06814|nr:DUF2846 domain-containing protein [Acinetobacter dispersus]ENX55690.1 hypothetical protein F901_00541 [Acinetobacter dispersus]MCH7394318.1 DUF2846 domain-containing protein [Acinetobacter dispersus]